MDRPAAHRLRHLLQDAVARVDRLLADAPLPLLVGVTVILALLAVGMLVLGAMAAAQP